MGPLELLGLELLGPLEQLELELLGPLDLLEPLAPLARQDIKRTL
jgi:hypothetical protein